jgi:hypothetical protein
MVLARYEEHHYKKGDKTVRVPKSLNRKPHNRNTGEGLKKVNAEVRKWAGVKRKRFPLLQRVGVSPSSLPDSKSSKSESLFASDSLFL